MSKVKAQNYYSEHKSQMLAQQKRYYAQNKDAIIKRNLQYYHKNKLQMEPVISLHNNPVFKAEVCIIKPNEEIECLQLRPMKKNKMKKPKKKKPKVDDLASIDLRFLRNDFDIGNRPVINRDIDLQLPPPVTPINPLEDMRVSTFIKNPPQPRQVLDAKALGKIQLQKYGQKVNIQPALLAQRLASTAIKIPVFDKHGRAQYDKSTGEKIMKIFSFTDILDNSKLTMNYLQQMANKNTTKDNTVEVQLMFLNAINMLNRGSRDPLLRQNLKNMMPFVESEIGVRFADKWAKGEAFDMDVEDLKSAEVQYQIYQILGDPSYQNFINRLDLLRGLRLVEAREFIQDSIRIEPIEEFETDPFKIVDMLEEYPAHEESHYVGELMEDNAWNRKIRAMFTDEEYIELAEDLGIRFNELEERQEFPVTRIIVKHMEKSSIADTREYARDLRIAEQREKLGVPISSRISGPSGISGISSIPSRIPLMPVIAEIKEEKEDWLHLKEVFGSFPIKVRDFNVRNAFMVDSKWSRKIKELFTKDEYEELIGDLSEISRSIDDKDSWLPISETVLSHMELGEKANTRRLARGIRGEEEEEEEVEEKYDIAPISSTISKKKKISSKPSREPKPSYLSAFEELLPGREQAERMSEWAEERAERKRQRQMDQEAFDREMGITRETTGMDISES